MLKEESLAFLKKCINAVEEASDEEIEKYKKAYKENMKCDEYCHSCVWNETIQQDGYYYHKCILHLNGINNQNIKQDFI